MSTRGHVPMDWLIVMASRLVPDVDRARFIEEWRGELAHVVGRAGRLRAFRVAVGAVPDAIAWRRLEAEPAGPGGGDRFRHDVRQAIRSLSRSGGFVVIAVVSLGVGIGANAAMFGIVRTAMIRPLPVPEAERLVQIWERRPLQGRERNVVSHPDFVDWRERSTVFDGMAAYRGAGATLALPDGSMRVGRESVSADYFEVLGADAVVGRVLEPGDIDPGAPPVVVLGQSLWRTTFGSNPDVVGTAVMLDGVPHEVIGVLGREPPVSATADVWLPLVGDPSLESRGNHSLMVVGKLREGVTIERASADLVSIAAGLEAEYPEVNTGHTVALVALREELLGDRRLALLVLFGGLSLLVLIVLVNLANLQMARATGRRQELALRSVLGASRGRLAGQLVIESAILGLCGALAATLVAWQTMLALASRVVDAMPWLAAPTLDVPVILFIMLISVLAVVLTGVVPALRLSRVAPSGAFADDRRGTGSRDTRRARAALVVAEFALALFLLVGAGLASRTLLALNAVDPGFDADRVLKAEVWLSDVAYETAGARSAAYDRILERVGSEPGIERAAITYMLPMSGMDAGRIFTVEGRPEPAPGEEYTARLRIASAGYFDVMGIPVLRGRTFEARDSDDRPLVALINEEMARQYWPGTDPLGMRFLLGETPIEIVGIAGDVHHAGPREPAPPEFYIHLAQAPIDFATVVVRTAGDPAAFVPALRTAIADVEPGLPLTRLEPMSARTRAVVSDSRVLAALVTAFAIAALLLATLGVYGVMSYSVNHRTREIGVRLAIGGQPAAVRSMVLRDGLGLVLVALPFGLAGAFVLARTMAHLLFGVTPADPVTFVGAAAILTVVAMVASLGPALRATRIDPMIAMRE